jgi:hypothetical protein
MNLSMMKQGQRLAGPVSVSAWTKVPRRMWSITNIRTIPRMVRVVKAKNQGVH